MLPSHAVMVGSAQSKERSTCANAQKSSLEKTVNKVSYNLYLLVSGVVGENMLNGNYFRGGDRNTS